MSGEFSKWLQENHRGPRKELEPWKCPVPCRPGHKPRSHTTLFCSNGFSVVFSSMNLTSYTSLSFRSGSWASVFRPLISFCIISQVLQPLWGLLSCSTFTGLAGGWDEILTGSLPAPSVSKYCEDYSRGCYLGNRSIQGHVQGVPGSWHEATPAIHLFHLWIYYNYPISVTSITLNS